MWTSSVGMTNGQSWAPINRIWDELFVYTILRQQKPVKYPLNRWSKKNEEKEEEGVCEVDDGYIFLTSRQHPHPAPLDIHVILFVALLSWGYLR